MKNSKVFIPFLALATFLFSCKTDVNIIAPYQEKAVIYGLLNQRDSIQYIRLSKVFLGKGDALQMAQQPDSIFYDPETVTLTLEAINPAGNLAKTIILRDTVLPPGDPGVFSRDPNLIYYTTEKLNEDFVYKLRMKNNQSNYEATSLTPLIDDVIISRIGIEIAFMTSPTEYSSFIPSWNTAKNGRSYELTIRFHYKEYTTAGDTAYKYIDWVQSIQESRDLNGSESLSQEIKGKDFYQFLQSRKASHFSNDNVNRLAGNLEFFVTIGGEELTVYSRLNKPSSTVIYQEKPFYTNVSNGLGVFSCRTKSSSIIRKMTSQSEFQLRNGDYTKDLNFR